MNLSGVIIRSAVNEDILQMRELLKATGLYFAPVDDDPANYEAQLVHDPGSVIVAEYECHVIGMVFYVHSPLFSVVAHLAVLPEFQRRGIGKMLFTEALQRLEKLGTCDRAGYIEEDNKASLRLCDELGLKEYPVKVIVRYL